jgi:hypothetical protein
MTARRISLMTCGLANIEMRSEIAMRGMTVLLYLALCAAVWPPGLWAGPPADTAMPWPTYYAEALRSDGQPLRYDTREDKDGVTVARYRNATGDLTLTVEYVRCEGTRCDALYETGLGKLNERLTAQHGEQNGEFRSVSPIELVAQWTADGLRYLVLFAKTPAAVVAWTRLAKEDRVKDDEDFITGIRAVLDRQRFDESSRAGSIAMGRWAPQIHRYAQWLLAQDRTQDAVAVLGQAIVWAPSDLEAQMDFAEHTPDAQAARASAQAVWDSAETETLTGRAGRLLGHAGPSLDSLPVLDRNLRGLQSVLVPLPPCDIRLVEAAGRLYERHFGIPVL